MRSTKAYHAARSDCIVAMVTSRLDAPRETTIYVDENLLRLAKVAAARSGKREYQIMEEALRSYLGLAALVFTESAPAGLFLAWLGGQSVMRVPQGGVCQEPGCMISARCYTSLERDTMPTVVGSKGQVVIEREIRNRLGVRPGSVAIQTLVGDRVEIRFIPPAHSESLFGVLSGHLRRDAAAREWAEVKRQAWKAAAMGKEQTPSRSRRTRLLP